MTIKLNEQAGGKVLEVLLTRQLVQADYDTFLPVLAQLFAQAGKIRVLLVMHGFPGWTTGVPWEDAGFAVQPFDAIERLAVVGEEEWQHQMTALVSGFTSAEVHYFDYSALDQAKSWIAGNTGLPLNPAAAGKFNPQSGGV